MLSWHLTYFGKPTLKMSKKTTLKIFVCMLLKKTHNELQYTRCSKICDPVKSDYIWAAIEALAAVKVSWKRITLCFPLLSANLWLKLRVTKLKELVLPLWSELFGKPSSSEMQTDGKVFFLFFFFLKWRNHQWLSDAFSNEELGGLPRQRNQTFIVRTRM